jgi:hypothetical protein
MLSDSFLLFKTPVDITILKIEPEVNIPRIDEKLIIFNK